MAPMNPEVPESRPKTGHVGSDFHMFSSRSHVEQHMGAIFDAAAQSDFLVLNGDTFDFHWTTRRSVTDTVVEAIEWMAELTAHAPGCHIHFILGNHDHDAEFIEAAQALVEETANLSLHPFYLRLGDAVFLHGDVTDRAKPRHVDLVERRTQWAGQGQKHLAMHRVYDAVTKAGLHRVVYFLKPKRLMAKRIEHYLREMEAETFEEINHVYFGHTHVPFTDHEHNGRSYHNTGSTIRGLKFNMLQIEVEH